MIFYNYYSNMFNNIFTWNNFPKSCNMEYFLRSMLESGRASFFKYNGSILSLKNADAGDFNIYGYATSVQNIGLGFSERGRPYIEGGDNSGADTVICWHTPQKNSPFIIINYYVNKIVSLLMTYETKLLQAKRPFIVTGFKKEVQNVSKILNDINNDVGIIVGNESLELNPINVLTTGVGMNDVKDVTDLINVIDNEFKEHFGINNNKNIDKKERLIVDEVNNNNNATNLMLDMMLKSRERFCNQCNELFGINISVEVNNALIEDNGGGEDNDDTVQGMASKEQ